MKKRHADSGWSNIGGAWPLDNGGGWTIKLNVGVAISWRDQEEHTIIITENEAYTRSGKEKKSGTDVTVGADYRDDPSEEIPF